MMNILAMNWILMESICIPLVVLAALCALFLLIVIMIQPGNSNGISALGGQQETFYGKNKGKTLESKLRKLTLITMIGMAVFMCAFCAVRFRSGNF